MPHFNKLTDRQKLKVKSVIANEWREVQVFLHNDDLRGIDKGKNYKSIEIQFTKNNERFNTIISGKVGYLK